jgi:hypothetical protein
MTTKNPFPGMNPFAEQRWRDAHTRLITYVCDALQAGLPPDLVAGAEEAAVAIGTGEPPRGSRPDVQVREPWLSGGNLGTAVAAPPALTATEPILVLVEEETQRWIEVHDETGRLVTVLELLSPSNKEEYDHRQEYIAKRQRFTGAGVNLVEIDLIRQGSSIFPKGIKDVLLHARASYAVCVFRAAKADREVYPIGLRDRLPVIRVPLRRSDADVLLDLQPLVDQCHERGRYHRLDYRRELIPPLSREDAQWLDELLRQHGLR